MNLRPESCVKSATIGAMERENRGMTLEDVAVATATIEHMIT